MFDIRQTPLDDDGDWDDARAHDYCDGLVQEFAESPEGAEFAEQFQCVGWAHSFLYYGLNYIGSTPPVMSRGDVEEILFEIFPRKVSTEPESASEIIGEMRAFWKFLHRQYGLANATEILGALDEEAEHNLEQELADAENFGLAKSFVMMGTEAGFDMTSPEGLEAFRIAYNARVLGHSSESMSPEVHPPVERAAARPARKSPLPQLSRSERKAREKRRRKKLGKSKRR